jgi:hypothetical protein
MDRRKYFKHEYSAKHEYSSKADSKTLAYQIQKKLKKGAAKTRNRKKKIEKKFAKKNQAIQERRGRG